jgi:hypothetical protein
MCEKDDKVPESWTLDEAIKWSKHRNEIRKETWKRRGIVAAGSVAILAWACLFAVGFLAHDRPEPIDEEVKALGADVSKTTASGQAEPGMAQTVPPQGWTIDKETRSHARIASLAAFAAVIGFLLGKKVKGEE